MMLFPVLLIQHLIRFFQELDEKNMRNQYGHLYEELDLRVGKMALIQPLFFILRRLMLAIVIAIINQNLIWQIMVMAY